jgi:GTP-binding protein HflX
VAERRDLPETQDTSHRGAFGEFGGEAGGLIERTFRERIVIVGVTLPGRTDDETQASLDELALLVDTAGADAVERIVQRRIAPDPATYLGRGKVDEVRACSDAVDADTVVFDDELTPAQQFNLERLLGRTVLDRTAVILDIFAQNAHSQEGKVQVELAQLRYRLPRLRGKGLTLSQQAGGIGTRGPGETQLEIDRRRILRRIQKLERDLRDLDQHRHVQRKARRRSDLATVAIVGYTNAGKSTLLNRLTHAEVLVENRLFATLDATTRRLDLPSGRQALLTDTVGFVRKLPHQLVEAFKSTLEVVAEADLLVHLVDGSSVDPDGEIAAVRDVLAEIGAGAVRELMVVNKLDRSPLASALAGRLDGIAVSARSGAGVPGLLERLDHELRPQTSVEEVVVPFERGEVMALVHRVGEVLSESACDDGMHYRVRLDEAGRRRLTAEVLQPGGR